MNCCEHSQPLAHKLVAWYTLNKRPLPWREKLNDSYAIWISEIMLQQTTVNAVIVFYNRWMERFPTLVSLAEAPLDDVLKQWAGLGYYARARNLKKAAELIVANFAGELPVTVSELLTLPGIGRYTAGAISSIAYQQDVPIVDANVMRVLCRIAALHGDPKTSVGLQKQVWTIAEELIPRGLAREFNQAMMELGALVCTPTTPDCPKCPVAEFCQAKRSGQPSAFPEFGEPKKWINVTHVACLVENDRKILMVQRPLEELWGGLWELPRVAFLEDESLDQAAARAVWETVGLEVYPPNRFGSLRHVVTNHKVTLEGFHAEWSGVGEAEARACHNFRWIDAEEFKNYAISSPQIRLLSIWQASRHQFALGI